MGGLDEASQTMDTVVELSLQWKSELFVWNGADYGGTYGIEFIQDEVWLPDLYVGNNAEAFTTFGHKYHKVQAIPCGRTMWKVNIQITTNCDIDISYYPFDTQKCDIQVIFKLSK